jgi:DeoR/GlpR family transcriptional regulator of sugar metabolism
MRDNSDHSRMHTHTLASVGPVEMIHVLVTDSGLAATDREALTARGVEVIIADE